MGSCAATVAGCIQNARRFMPHDASLSEIMGKNWCKVLTFLSGHRLLKGFIYRE
jgi:hypothetical protein